MKKLLAVFAIAFAMLFGASTFDGEAKAWGKRHYYVVKKVHVGHCCGCRHYYKRKKVYYKKHYVKVKKVRYTKHVRYVRKKVVTYRKHVRYVKKPVYVKHVKSYSHW